MLILYIYLCLDIILLGARLVLTTTVVTLIK